MSEYDDTDRAYDVAEDLRARIRTLEAERDQAREDAKVLAEAVRSFEKESEGRTPRKDGPLAEALERNKP